MIDKTLFAGLYADGHTYSPVGGVRIDTLCVRLDSGATALEVPVVTFEVADGSPPRDIKARTWGYVVPLARVERLWYIASEVTR